MKKFFARAIMFTWSLSCITPCVGWLLSPVLDGIIPDDIVRWTAAISVGQFLFLTVAIFGGGVIEEKDL